MQRNLLQVFEPNEKFFDSHITFTSVADIEEITKPLLKIGITYFTFDRTYKDNSHIRLTNAGKWIASYYRDRLYDVAIFEKNPTLFSEGYVFWSWLKREPIYSAAALFDIDHGLTITQPHDSYCDFFHFGTKCSNEISPDTMILNIHLLHQFIAIFKQKALKLIIEAENTRFILPVKTLTHFSLDDVRNISETENIDVFKQNEIKRLYLGEEFDNAYITRKEIEILGLLKEGKKPVEIAKIAEMSERTIETHIKNLKSKLKCRTLFDLGFATHSLGLHNIFPFHVESIR